MIVAATDAAARSILGAMRLVPAPLSPADRAMLQAAYRYVFRGAGELDLDALPDVAPGDLARALPDADLAQHAARFLAVMALVDGAIDGAKIERVGGLCGGARRARGLSASARGGRRPDISDRWRWT